MTGIISNTLKSYFFVTSYKNARHLRYINNLQLRLQSSLAEVKENISHNLLKVAIIGMPNSGKSTLINNLMDRKVCPTSAKVHTTRTKATAIFTVGDSQIIFLDTPGVVNDRMKKKFNLEKSFINDSEACLKLADRIGVVHDVTDNWTRERLDIKLINLLEKHEDKPSFLILNKIDVLKSKRKLLELTRLITMNCLDGKPLGKVPETKEEERGWPNFKDIFMVSALTGDGLPEVKNYLIKNAKPANWMYPADVWTDQQPENIVVNTIKATLLDFLPQEIPYQMEPVLEHYEEVDGSLNVVVLVNCASERVAKLVAGVAGGRLRQITESAKKDLQDVFQQFVKIRIILQPPRK